MNIGILNAGGDCPGLNAVIEGAVAAASARGWTVYGFYDGFEGLLSTPENELPLPGNRPFPARRLERLGCLAAL